MYSAYSISMQIYISVKTFRTAADNKLLTAKRNLGRSVSMGTHLTWIRYSSKGSTPHDVKFHRQDSNIIFVAGSHSSVDSFNIMTRQVRENHGKGNHWDQNWGHVESWCDAHLICSVINFSSCISGQGSKLLPSVSCSCVSIY